MMRNKDFQKIAFTLRRLTDELKDHLGEKSREMMMIHHIRVCTDIAVMLKNQNPRFDRDKFLDACGVL